jgi:hypothetical protein
MEAERRLTTSSGAWRPAALRNSNAVFRTLHELRGFQYQRYSHNDQGTPKQIFVGPVGKLPFLACGVRPPFEDLEDNADPNRNLSITEE